VLSPLRLHLLFNDIINLTKNFAWIFLGFGMWSGPPYCETKDLMNRIRKIHFKKHNSNNEDEEFDNYMTI